MQLLRSFKREERISYLIIIKISYYYIKMVKVGKFNYEKSTRPTKKLMTVVNGKTIHFGDRNSDHFKDKTGIWKSKDHLDKERRKNYLTRSAGIKDKDGNLTKDDPASPNYHARRILW